MPTPQFQRFVLQGIDAQKFLQGQVTAHVERLPDGANRYTVICDLKGRIQFGIWLCKISSEQFELVVTQDQAADFAGHIRKYGAFSKMTLSAAETVYPEFMSDMTVFGLNETDVNAWQHAAIRAGQAWVDATTAHVFQPQELRLHQRDGVHYDKGCYLGQEVVARLWFKAKPKHWLHLIQASGAAPKPATQLSKDVEVVNSVALEDGYLALVVAKPDALTALDVTVLDLPEGLNGDVGRPV